MLGNDLNNLLILLFMLQLHIRRFEHFNLNFQNFLSFNLGFQNVPNTIKLNIPFQVHEHEQILSSNKFFGLK
jgi:hypothetical protein